ncbi:uncharacterized protein BDR25DRAFT_310942 [Lindgomyces ingoldianus]|uniref:Uncharacterized protein n=1 Tax=Lindgomyces ingoldianus TaxID=673940 RepID=A0ACB6RAV3_9PLEO|nr:uncharacterized protein BDR25DRAFT_310942 [Lindgomyces ingoldianus]KAF2475596.1 hypothetical protein BDR25DRAFT_310942 [Lindgomyces ingoldianus]
MRYLFAALILLQPANAAWHYLFVGTIDASSIYTLEFNDVAKNITVFKNSSASGASRSITLDHSKTHLFGSRPADGTISRYFVEADYSLVNEGAMEIPQSCNTTAFASIKLITGSQDPYLIYGAATTGSCSSLFLTLDSGYRSLKSDAISGNIFSIAFSPNGRHLHALDSKSRSILNFYISDDPTFRDLLDKDFLPNATSPKQIITHPFGHRIFVVSQDTNELIEVPLLNNDRIDASLSDTRHAILPKKLGNGKYSTTSLAISSSNSTLWTLSQSKTPGQNGLITVYKLDGVTGAIAGRLAQVNWKTSGNAIHTGMTSSVTPAPFDGDLVAVTSFPMGTVEIWGVQKRNGTERVERIAGIGSFDVDQGCCGEAAWVN